MASDCIDTDATDRSETDALEPASEGEKAGRHPPSGGYWSFYWPLALMGVAMLTGRLVQNFVLLDFPQGVEELALFALAVGIFHPLDAALIFVPHMSNILVRGPKSLARTFRFTISIGVVLTVPLLLLGWTELGRVVVPRIYAIDEPTLERILQYLRLLTPLIVVGAASKFFNGLLVKARRTGMVTLLRVANLGALIAMLAVGLRLGWRPVVTVSVAWLVAEGLFFLGSLALVWKYHAVPTEETEPPPTYGKIARFFLPMALTTVMFSLSRPIILRFITMLNPEGDPALPNVSVMIAAISLAFSFSFLFHGMVNQFRHLLTTFGREDMPGIVRFMKRVTTWVTVVQMVAVATPASIFFLRVLQGAEGETLRMAHQALWILCLVPAVVAWRNYYHGLAMVHHRTFAMGVGGVTRNVAIYLCAAGLFRLGWYNHATGAGMVLVGFSAEGLTVMLASRGWRARLNGEPEPAPPPPGGTRY